VDRRAAESSARTIDAAGVSLSHGFGGLLPLLGYLPWVILIPVVAFFLLKDGKAFRRNILLTLPRGRLRGRGAEVFEDINDTLAAYMRAALLACLLVGGLCTIGFVLIDVPYALLFGVVAGLLEFIPLVGPLVVAVGATLVASFHSVGQAVVVLVFLGILRIAQDYVIYPRLIGCGIHMHPLAVILAILCGAELAGVAAPAGVDGRSFAALLHGRAPAGGKWRTDFLVEHWTADEGGIPPYSALRSDSHLYVEYPEEERELYDLRADPYELHNVHAAADPSLRERLSRRLAALKACAGATCRDE